MPCGDISCGRPASYVYMPIAPSVQCAKSQARPPQGNTRYMSFSVVETFDIREVGIAVFYAFCFPVRKPYPWRRTDGRRDGHDPVTHNAAYSDGRVMPYLRNFENIPICYYQTYLFVGYK